MSYRLGVDVGGTFTDLVLVSRDAVGRTCKVLSTADMGGDDREGLHHRGVRCRRAAGSTRCQIPRARLSMR